MGVQVRALDSANVLLYETQADEVGGLYSYMAGYDTLSLAPTVLTDVYAEYKLPANLSGFPHSRTVPRLLRNQPRVWTR